LLAVFGYFYLFNLLSVNVILGTERLTFGDNISYVQFGGDRGRGVAGDRGCGRNRKRGASQALLSGSNLSAIDTDAPADRDRKRKAEEDKATEEAKKVKLMELASPSSASEAAPTALASSSSSSSSSRRGGKSLIGILMSGQELDVARGFKLFD
jgi:hypothetical protein